MQEVQIYKNGERLADHFESGASSEKGMPLDRNSSGNQENNSSMNNNDLDGSEESLPLKGKIHKFLKDKYCTEADVVGVEIKPDCLRICQAKQENGKWNINKIVYKPTLNTNDYESLKKNKAVYVKALKEAFKSNKITNSNIALSIPASMAIIKVISLPLMTEQNLEKATGIESFWKNLVQLSGELKDYSIYYRIVEKFEDTKEMDVLFVACKNDDLNAFREIAEEAGLYVVVADIACFSINNLSKLKETKSEEVEVYLKVGKDENYLQIVDTDKPYIYDIFVPENEKAYLNEYLEHQTFQQRFTSQLKHVITKHEDKIKSKITKINIISDEVNIKEFIKSLNSNLENIKIKEAKLFDSIKMRKNIAEDEEFLQHNSAWAVSAGLATRNLQIFEDENKKSISETINLLPEAKIIKEKLKSIFYSKIITGSVGIFSLLVVFIFGIYSYGQYQSNYSRIINFNELNKEYKSQQLVFNNINVASGSLNKLVSLRKDLNSNQNVIINSFKEIAQSIPEGVWIEEVEIAKQGEITIEGKSYLEKGVIKFSKMFEESSNIKEVNIGSIKTLYNDSGTRVKEFVINGKLK